MQTRLSHYSMSLQVRVRQRRLERVAAMAVCVLAVVGAIASARSVKAPSKPKYTTVVVQSGDTLWTLARAHTPTSRDLRATLYDMEKLNRLRSATIQPGQRLRIPQ